LGGTGRVTENQTSVCIKSSCVAASLIAKKRTVDAINADEKVAIGKKKSTLLVEKESTLN
jgi:hypothetical protein